MPKQRASPGASDKRSIGKSSRSRKRPPSLSRRIRDEVKTAAEILAFVMGVLGILYLPRLANIAITTITILGLILFRRRSSIQIFRNLRSRSTSRAYLYALGFVALIAIIGSFSFIIGNKLGQTSAARSILKSLDLPAHPIPPPRPRFPGDVSLDEYCRSEGPYTVMAPTRERNVRANRGRATSIL